MPPSPKVSVIVPVYNVEKYLDKCLASIVSQSLEEIEVIVVNDCTPDASEDIIHAYMQKDDRIVYIKHDRNLGLGGARNTGIEAAKGDCIGFVDADDWVHPDMYETMAHAMETRDVDMVECSVNNVYEDTDKVEPRYVHRKRLLNKNLVNYYMKAYLKEPGFIASAVWNKLFRKSLLRDHGIRFLAHVFYEDMPVVLKALHYSRGIFQIPQFFYNYLQREKAITKSISSGHIQSEFTIFFKEIRPFLLEKGIYMGDGIKYFYSFFYTQMASVIWQIYHCSQDTQEVESLLTRFFKEAKTCVDEGWMDISELVHVIGPKNIRNALFVKKHEEQLIQYFTEGLKEKTAGNAV